MNTTLDLTQPVLLADGRAVRIVCYDMLGDAPLLGLIRISPTTEQPMTWRKDGTCTTDNPDDSLVNKTPRYRPTLWTIFFRDGTVRATFEQPAFTADDKKAVLAVRSGEVTFVEGEGL